MFRFHVKAGGVFINVRKEQHIFNHFDIGCACSQFAALDNSHVLTGHVVTGQVSRNLNHGLKIKNVESIAYLVSFVEWDVDGCCVFIADALDC